jgi:hypothetical protein
MGRGIKEDANRGVEYICLRGVRPLLHLLPTTRSPFSVLVALFFHFHSAPGAGMMEEEGEEENHCSGEEKGLYLVSGI